MARFASDWNRQASNKEWMSEPALTTLRVPRAKPLETSPTTPRRAIDPTTDWVDEWVPAELGQAARNFSKLKEKSMCDRYLELGPITSMILPVPN